MSSRILIDIGQIRSLPVGLGQFACQYARGLLAQPDSEFDFRFLAQPEFRDFPESVPGADIAFAQFSPLGWLKRRFNRQPVQWVSKEMGHVLSHGLYPDHHPLHRKDHAPFVVTFHDLHILRSGRKAKRIKSVMDRMQKSINRASAVVSISEDVQQDISEHLNLSGKILKVIYNGIEKPVPNDQPPSWFKNSRPFLFSLCTLAKHKNHVVLPGMLRHLPDFDLIICGKRKQDNIEAIESAIRAAGVADRVFLPGPANDGEKAWLLKHCAGFVFPSLREGFGMPVVEALHFGKPTFCLKNTSLPEVGGDVACYWDNCEPEHMAEVVRANLDSTPAVEKQRRDWAAEFSWQRNVEQHISLYREVLEGI